ncbi:MAG: HAD-IA family hydrolase, partial [Pseudomonadota bacterium]|nr:HAD-IA family hydrolase [Pseudomonadota bacterium]
LQSYGRLPAFEDAAQGLSDLSAAGHRLFAFSNGSADAVEGLLQHAGIRRYFEAVVSCDDLKSFKPNPAVYAHFLRQADSPASNAWLVSSNPFDVIGSISAGMRAAWVKRSPDAVFDPWDIQPTAVVGNLKQLQSVI